MNNDIDNANRYNDPNTISNELLYHRLVLLNRILEKRNIRFNPEKNNIARGQGRILAVLKIKDNISTKEMAEIFNISVGSLNETLNKLEQKGFIEKIPSEEDKRVKLIKLTEKGKEIKFNKPKDIDIFDILMDDEKVELNKLLNKLTMELHNKLKEEDPEKYEKMNEHRQKVLKKHFDCKNMGEEWFNIFRN